MNIIELKNSMLIEIIYFKIYIIIFKGTLYLINIFKNIS